ncbi:MAG: aminotransferase class V-fold PLP-dependent enzyme, partial [Acidobacteriota bacterium]
MEFVVQKENLLTQLTLVQGIVERKTTMPILSNVLMQTGPEGVSIMATDLEVALATRCEAVVGRQGEVAVQARKLFDVVRSLPPGEIQFRALGEMDLGIECEQARFTLRGLLAADFPSIPEATVAKPILLPAADLRQMISRVAFAVTVDDPVYSLNGALMLMDGYQGLGTIDVDATASGADFIVGGMVKYLLGTAGIGFMYVRS